MDALSLQLATPPPAPPTVSGAPHDLPQPRLEAPPFEGKLQRDAFVKQEIDADEALRSFIDRARTIATVRSDSLRVPQLPTDPELASPVGGGGPVSGS